MVVKIEGSYDKRKEEALKKLKKKRYDLEAMEELFTLGSELLNVDGEDFDKVGFNEINRYIQRELNYAMAKLGMNDKNRENKIMFNEPYIQNCHNLMTVVIQSTLNNDHAAQQKLCLALHDYLSPYSERLKDVEPSGSPKNGNKET